MPVIRHPSQLEHHRELQWARQAWAGAAAFAEDVPMVAHRHRVEPGAESPLIPLGGQEAMAYVISGSGTARAAGETFPLAAESMLWLAACHGLALRAGPQGLDVLAAESAAVGGPVPAPLCKVFSAGELPHLVSTRDTRDRLDLVTENVPVGAALIRADRILYHPGDTAAAHYHSDCHHVFCVLAGSGLLYTSEPDSPEAGGHPAPPSTGAHLPGAHLPGAHLPGAHLPGAQLPGAQLPGEQLPRAPGPGAHRLTAGDSALVGPGEVHWFENDTGEEFSFVEFWAPPPSGTVWTVTGDRCTWAPAR
jgi:quercetin dioxygenase-like cupin family protein